MAGKVVIRAEGLGKKYQIRHRVIDHAPTLRDGIVRSSNKLMSAALNMLQGRSIPPINSVEDFWALRDVDFEIEQGEVVGIVGRNGAGKSTMLKILSRITEPSEGSVQITGRIASLLEVGTGFHPELSGRENVYLNGAILGMRRSEITRKFDEIVDFAGVEKFIDTPVKRYSSGMQVRLAFAVAAHLEPEILLVDEVLAVGDADFQKKSLAAMKSATQSGRTILFVSHNMAALQAFCTRAILLDAGRKVSEGDTSSVILRYINTQTSDSSYVNPNSLKAGPIFQSVKIINPNVTFDDVLVLEIKLRSTVSTVLGIEIDIQDNFGAPIAYLSNAPMGGRPISIEPEQEISVILRIGPLNLASGSYRLNFTLIRPWVEVYDTVPNPLCFEIITSDPMNSGFEYRQSYGRGAFYMPFSMEIGPNADL